MAKKQRRIGLGRRVESEFVARRKQITALLEERLSANGVVNERPYGKDLWIWSFMTLGGIEARLLLTGQALVNEDWQESVTSEIDELERDIRKEES